MKNAIIIGGGGGLGGEAAKELRRHEYNVLTVGRTPGKCDFACDAGNPAEFESVLSEISDSVNSIDVLGCIVGGLRTGIDTMRNLSCRELGGVISMNAHYPFMAYNMLKDKFHGDSKVITVGSRWTYRTDFPDHVWSYAYAKRLLYKLSVLHGNDNRNHTFLHFCVPLMDTPMYRKGSSDFKKHTGRDYPAEELKDVSMVAKVMIDKVLSGDRQFVLPYAFTESGGLLELHKIDGLQLFSQDYLFYKYFQPYIDSVNSVITPRNEPLQSINEFVDWLARMYYYNMKFFYENDYTPILADGERADSESVTHIIQLPFGW